MSDLDGLVVYDEEFEDMVAKWAAVTNKSLDEVLFDEAGHLLKAIIKVTPPFSGGASIGKAKKQGTRRITRDLQRIFAPVKLKGSRTITQVFGKPVTPFEVPTRELHPNVEAIYADAKRMNNTRARGRHSFGRSKLYVDERKFKRLERKLHKKTGYLGGGFAPAAQRLGVKLPAFMARHGGRAPGSFLFQTNEDSVRVIMTNAVPYVHRIGGMEKRVFFALQRREKALATKIKYALRANEKLMT